MDQKQINKRNNSFIVLLAVVLPIVVSLILIFVLLILFVHRYGNASNVKSETQYRKLQYNSATNEMTVRLVALDRKIKKDDYLFYRDEEDNHVLISNMESEEFKCSGSCMCEGDYVERRAATTVLSRGMTVLLVALSSVYAVNMAQNILKEDCFNKFHDTCDERNIFVDMEECYPAMSSESNSKPEIEDDAYSQNDAVMEVDEGKYFCRGACLPNPQVFKEVDIGDSEKLQKYMASFCSGITLKGYLTIGENVDFSQHFQSFNAYFPEDVATYHFSRTQLDVHCRKKSQRSVGRKDLTEPAPKKKTKKWWRKKIAREGKVVSVCVGVSINANGNVYQSKANKCSKPTFWHKITKWF